LFRVLANAGRRHADAHVSRRHKDMCEVLHKLREVVKDGVAPDSCTADLVAFLQRERVAASAGEYMEV
jgi:hypothetical protein